MNTASPLAFARTNRRKQLDIATSNIPYCTEYDLYHYPENNEGFIELAGDGIGVSKAFKDSLKYYQESKNFLAIHSRDFIKISYARMRDMRYSRRGRVALLRKAERERVVTGGKQYDGCKAFIHHIDEAVFFDAPADEPLTNLTNFAKVDGEVPGKPDGAFPPITNPNPSLTV